MAHAMVRDILDRHPILRLLLYLATIVAVLYTGGLLWSVILHFGGIILIFFLAWVIAFIFYPLALYLERRGMSRLLAVSLIYVAMAGLLVGGIVLLVPIVRAQVEHFAGQLTVTFTPSNLSHLSTQATTWLQRLGLRKSDAQQLISQIDARLPALASQLSTQAANIAAGMLGTIASVIFDVVLIAILSFYMMLDGDRLLDSWILKLPPSWLPDVRLFQRHIEVIFGGFLRAQLIISLIYGVLSGLTMVVVGMWQVAVIVAILAAILMVIPFIGPFVSVVPPLLFVLVESPSGALIRNLIIVFAVLMVMQHLVLNVLAPKIMSTHVGVHPLVIFAALLVGAQEGGAWGAVFAGPVAAIIVAVLDVFFVRFQQSSPLYPNIVSDPTKYQEARDQAQAEERTRTAFDQEARRRAEAEVEAEQELEADTRARHRAEEHRPRSDRDLEPAGTPARRKRSEDGEGGPLDDRTRHKHSDGQTANNGSNGQNGRESKSRRPSLWDRLLRLK
jgi:predicted PurR-regulated permease PerM